MSRILPRTKTPDLSLPMIDGGKFDLADSKPENFTMLVFYRGYHCPLCKNQLLEIQDNRTELEDRGVKIIAASMDSEERASKSKNEWELPEIDIAYGMSEELARSFGLYLSHAREGGTEPALFSEPGLFLIRPDQTLYCAALQTMPFTRPPLDQLMQAIDFVVAKDYPPRGEVA